jgi:hypothetical protein
VPLRTHDTLQGKSKPLHPSSRSGGHDHCEGSDLWWTWTELLNLCSPCSELSNRGTEILE